MRQKNGAAIDTVRKHGYSNFPLVYMKPHTLIYTQVLNFPCDPKPQKKATKNKSNANPTHHWYKEERRSTWCSRNHIEPIVHSPEMRMRKQLNYAILFPPSYHCNTLTTRTARQQEQLSDNTLPHAQETAKCPHDSPNSTQTAPSNLIRTRISISTTINSHSSNNNNNSTTQDKSTRAQTTEHTIQTSSIHKQSQTAFGKM